MKTFTKILCIVLAVMMLASLVACNKGEGEDKKESIVGKWEGTISDKATEAILGEIEMDIDLKTDLVICFEFKEDGNATMSFDEDSMKDYIEEVALATLEAMADEYEMSEEDMLEMMQMTKEEYVEAAMAEVDFDEMVSEFTYTINDDKLTMVDEDDGKSVITFDLEGDKLKMKDIEEEGASEEMVDALFPMTLKRVK